MWFSWLANVFRRRNKGRKKDYLTNTIKHCLERLKPENKDYFKYFVLFPEDVNITCKTLEVVLKKKRYDVEDIVTELRNKSLIVSAFNHELECYVYGIHALLLGYLKAVIDPEELRKMHEQLVQCYLTVANKNYANLPNDNYIYTYIGHHLREAKLVDQFPQVYFDLHFLAAKARAAGVADVQLDLRRYKNYIIRDHNSELQHRLEACEKFIREYGQMLCDRPILDVIQLALLSDDREIRQLSLSAAALTSHKLYMRSQSVGGFSRNSGALSDEMPKSTSLDFGRNVCAACFAHHADLVLVGESDGQLRMWNHLYKSAAHDYFGHKDVAIRHLEATVEKKYFLSLADDGYVKIWLLDERTRTSEADDKENGFSSDECVPSPRVRQPAWVDILESSTGETGARPSDTSKLFRLMDDPIITASFSKYSENLLIVGTKGGQVVVWQIENGKKLFERKHQEQKPINACALADDDHLVVFAVENRVYIYDLESGEYLSHLMDEPDARQLLVVDSDENQDVAIVVRSLHALTVWRWHLNYEEGRYQLNEPSRVVLARLENAREEYTCAAVTEDGLYLIAGISTGSLLMWSLSSSECPERQLATPGTSPALCLDTFLDEKSNSNVVYVLLSGGGGDGRVRCWHMTPSFTEQHDSNGDLSLNIDVSLTSTFAARWVDGDKPLVAAATQNGSVRMYIGCSIVAEVPSTSMVQKPSCLAMSPDGGKVAIGLVGGLVYVFENRTKQLYPVMHLDGDVTYLEYVVQRNGSSVLVAATDAGCIMSSTNNANDHYMRLQRAGGTGLVMSEWLSERLITVAKDGSVKSWEVSEGELRDVLVAGNSSGPRVTAACLTVKRDRLCIVRNDGEVRIYSLEITGNDIPTVTCHFLPPKSESLRKKEPPKPFKLSDSPLVACAWSSDARHLAVSDDKSHVYVLNVSPGGDLSKLACLTDHRTAVHWLMWSTPSGAAAPSILATAGDNLLLFWDTTRLAERSTTNMGPRRKSGVRRSRPEPLDLTVIGPALPEIFSDPAWAGKHGSFERPELLGAVPMKVNNIFPSPNFTRFVTVDVEGMLHVFSVLRSSDLPDISPT